MKTVEGKIQISLNNLGANEEFTHSANEEFTHRINVEQVAKIEMFLNNEVALIIYENFGALIRVHM